MKGGDISMAGVITTVPNCCEQCAGYSVNADSQFFKKQIKSGDRCFWNVFMPTNKLCCRRCSSAGGRESPNREIQNY